MPILGLGSITTVGRGLETINIGSRKNTSMEKVEKTDLIFAM